MQDTESRSWRRRRKDGEGERKDGKEWSGEVGRDKQQDSVKVTGSREVKGKGREAVEGLPGRVHR